MVEHTQADETDESLLTRRRVGAGVVTGTLMVGVAAASTDRASAQVSNPDFSASGASKTLSKAPAAIRIMATGEWAVETSGGVEQVMITLQAQVNGETADLTTDRVFEQTSGTYDLSADVIENHRDVTAQDFMPDETGGEKVTDIDIAVIVSAVRDGEIAAEARASDTATVTVSGAGVDVSVGGSADVTIEADDA